LSDRGVACHGLLAAIRLGLFLIADAFWNAWPLVFPETQKSGQLLKFELTMLLESFEFQDLTALIAKSEYVTRCPVGKSYSTMAQET
jgi:hypothetical protein